MERHAERDGCEADVEQPQHEGGFESGNEIDQILESRLKQETRIDLFSVDKRALFDVRIQQRIILLSC